MTGDAEAENDLEERDNLKGNHKNVDNGSLTPLEHELEEEEQDMVQTDEELRLQLIDNVICGDLFERLNMFQV